MGWSSGRLFGGSRLLVALVTLVGVCPLGLVHAAEGDSSGSHRVVHGWPALPDGWMLGQASAVDVDSHGHVFVLHRASRPWKEPFPEEPIPDATVAVWDGPSGRLLAEWGAGQFVMPHGLSIDADDNVWTTDVGLHQVKKFGHDGDLRMTLGEAGVPGADAGHFARPTDVAVRPDGGFYVSDGYVNTRVVRFSPSGGYELEWGAPGQGPGEFRVPHDLALGPDGRVYVADRGNARVQVFDAEGRFQVVWDGGDRWRPYALAPGPGGALFVLDGGDLPKSLPDRSRVLKLDHDGQMLGVFGRFGNQDGQFHLPHDLAVGPDGAVYVVDVWGRRAQKFVPATSSTPADE